jgi:DNA-binding IclR family transcriptional regulator
VARPHLEWLRTTLDETSHLVVLIGHDVHFIASAEARRPLRVGARVGAVLPAHRTSGGKALLAALPREEIEHLYPLGQAGRGLLTMTETAILRRELETTRRRGYGINMGESERGIAALGVLVRGYDGHPIAAVTVSVPAVRFSGDRVKELVSAIKTAAKRIDADLALQTPAQAFPADRSDRRVSFVS